MDLRAMDLRGYQFIQREIGEDAVYPGHPITVGLLIMCAFPTLEAAEDRGPEGQNFTAASRSSMIPGAGGSVGTALGILRDVVKGVLTITGAIARADEAWRDVDGQYVRDPKRWREGQEQANPLKARYTTLLHSWGPVADAPCALCFCKVEGGDLDDYFVFDEPIADRTFAPARYVTGEKMLPVFEGAKGRPIHAHYGCVGDLLWRRQGSIEVQTLERALAAIGGSSTLPPAKRILQRLLAEAQGRWERDRTTIAKLRELQAEGWGITACRGAETLPLDELVSKKEP